ncbi:MAG: SpoIVB peptidase [Clostridium sp.]
MKNRYIKGISFIITLVLIIVLSSIFTIKDLPDKIYISNSVSSTTACKSLSPLNSIQYNEDSIDIKLMGLFNIKSMEVQKVDGLRVEPGGYSVGIKIDSDGVLVVGFSDVLNEDKVYINPSREGGIQLGDIILEIDGVKTTCTADVARLIEGNKNSKIKIELLRGDEHLNREISLINENGENKIGLWVRDSTAGVGTMTFSHKESGAFGALGHPITDTDTNELFKIKDGELYDSAIISLRKGEKGNPGELKGIFTDEKNPLGVINKNTECGIFGEIEKGTSFRKSDSSIEVGFRSDVKVGKAQIITTIDEEGPKKYDIEIVKKLEQDAPGPKSMIIKVTDKRLLDSTGGIIQGMSGSPIIQDNKLVGAVTHVLINKPDVGYGIYIEWMLKDAGILR